jgi:replicative superfamily II helicase
VGLHPIKALDAVVEEYRDYLLTEFRAKDPNLRDALEREMDRPLFLSQEAFFQAHRPFKPGTRWVDLPIDNRLAGVMVNRAHNENAFLHQSRSISHLLGPDASPLVVTTGTGSGKTECFLLPVIQNAISDAVHFKKDGLTSILIYPMNALANDQFERIQDYLAESGFQNAITVAKYDRGTTQTQREALRKKPPHILLTNYMMLEYLLTRPADREAIFANHRCRFLVLDEVHTYRGTLGTNIALLIRRLQAHLKRATQDWGTNIAEEERTLRFPSLIPIGASATIKSVDEEGLSEQEMLLRRDHAVQEFFAKLIGAGPETIRVVGEELADVQIPATARYAPEPVVNNDIDIDDPEQVRKGLCRLAGLSEDHALEEAADMARIIWDLGAWLVSKPMSVSQMVDCVRSRVPQRQDIDPDLIRTEVESALAIGAAIPDQIAGNLRLRAHRFMRGGWSFHRCVNPDCGRLYPMGEEQCVDCGSKTAPLFLCRNCGADYLRFVGDNELKEQSTLQPSSDLSSGGEWLLYEPSRFEDLLDDDPEAGEDAQSPQPRTPRLHITQIKKRSVEQGSLDISNLTFSRNEAEYPLKIVLTPGRTRCLCCGGTAGSKSVLTPVSLGTSAAVKVLGEGLVEALAQANAGREGHDGKERLLIFSDSRQDAAHQARFIYFASRYDRMRHLVYALLKENGGVLTFQRAVELMGDTAVHNHDNPWVPEDEGSYIHSEQLQRIQAWEEAPLLDELAVSTGYRSTLFNLGVAGVNYDNLNLIIAQKGETVAKKLGISVDDLANIGRSLLDEMRRMRSVSRGLLTYHPSNPSMPSYFRAAEWERRVKQPAGYAADSAGNPVPNMNAADVESGITPRNFWRKHGVGGRSPAHERILKHLLAGLGGKEPADEDMMDIIKLLMSGGFIKISRLSGLQRPSSLLQVNDEAIRLVLLNESERLRCNICGYVQPFRRAGFPCSRCHGKLMTWADQDVEQNRNVRRIKQDVVEQLVAKEHTAQVPGDDRKDLEDDFKARPEESPLNVLACSPTLEMGIDVGGLDAVIMRNVPPRPDNYAQRGGRAGRRTRVGLVVGYARSTPHDQYFYDKPEEMIAGEVPAPLVPLGNRDVILRHLASVAFGSAEPGLSGKMVEYVDPNGNLNNESINALVQGVMVKSDYAVQLCQGAFGHSLLATAGLDEQQLRAYMNVLPGRIRDVFERTAKQVIDLRQALDAYAQELRGERAGTRAAKLIARLLGIPVDARYQTAEADDRSAGYPLRRFAEFGILPGYEFPTVPATLRLLGDPHEEDPISVARRFGISQYQPSASVFARTTRWKVIGLDNSSPWNPRNDEPGWTYRICPGCGLHYDASEPRCRRCGDATPGGALPGYEFAGFLAIKDENPVLDEEERYAARNTVTCQPQWNGQIIGRWRTTPGWSLCLFKKEEIRWLNEGFKPSRADMESGRPLLHEGALGWLICGSCGRLLTIPEADDQQRGRRRASRAGAQDPYGHGPSCQFAGRPPQPLSIQTVTTSEVLRIIVPVPADVDKDGLRSWGLSLGYALRTGLRHYFMLDGSEIEFELEGPWDGGERDRRCKRISLSFIDPSLGGSGYLERMGNELHLVASRALEHLDHVGCETACYRCLKAYNNQRYHHLLNWPQIINELTDLAQHPPELQALDAADLDDPRPWLEAYQEGVGSPLELRFLRLFEQYGLHPQKQVPVSPAEDRAPISIADFALPDKRVAIYIDGAAFHVGVNLRRDMFIRRSLREGNPPWQVIELRAQDLGRVKEIVEQIIKQQ